MASSSVFVLRVAFFIGPAKPAGVANFADLANLANLATLANLVVVRAELLLVFLRLVRFVVTGFDMAMLGMSVVSLMGIGVFLALTAIEVRGRRNRELRVPTG